MRYWLLRPALISLVRGWQLVLIVVTHMCTVAFVFGMLYGEIAFHFPGFVLTSDNISY